MNNYNMWSRTLQNILQLGLEEYMELQKQVMEALYRTIDKFAWELMVTNNMSLYEARYYVIKQMREMGW